MSLHAVLSISRLTYMEAVRNRVLYLLLIFGILFVLGSRLVGMLTVGDEIKVMTDLGLVTLTMMDLLIAVFVGIDLLHKELDKRTIYVMLAKPVRRVEFLLGKYLGLILTLGLIHAGMTAMFIGYSAVLHGPTIRILAASAGTFLEIAVITAAALMYSSFSTPILSGVFTLGTWLIGRGLPSLHWFMEKLNPGIARSLIYGLYLLLPNLSRFNLETYAVYGVPMPPGYFLSLAVTAVVYITLFLTLTAVVFQRRDFP